MGIPGLFPKVKNACTGRDIIWFQGKRIAVDIFHYIIRRLMAQKAKVVPENVVNYVMDIMEVLLAFGVKPVVVFDGKPLPAKQATYDKRQK